jgi:D-alanyl-D-alanine endopeptidase (penicillin-binding protein 7)
MYLAHLAGCATIRVTKKLQPFFFFHSQGGVPMRRVSRTVLLIVALCGASLLNPAYAAGRDADSHGKSHKTAKTSDKKAEGKQAKGATSTKTASKSSGKAERLAKADKKDKVAAKQGGRGPQHVAAKEAAKASAALAAVKPATSIRRVSSAAGDDWKETQKLLLSSSAALVQDQTSGEFLYQKNAQTVVPIASITKLMTAMVVLDSKPSLTAPVTISEDDIDTLRGSRSRLMPGTTLSREQALLLALMSSENRAAHALARHYPGGLSAFIPAMNRKAQELGMTHTHFEDPTGLTSNNVSTARDLARMVAAAHQYPLIREFSTTAGAQVDLGRRTLDYNNTNALVKSNSWEIGLSKTGYIHEAGKCLVMQARVADKPVVIVLLDSAGKQTRIGDAIRIKRWMESASLPRHSNV